MDGAILLFVVSSLAEGHGWSANEDKCLLCKVYTHVLTFSSISRYLQPTTVCLFCSTTLKRFLCIRYLILELSERVRKAEKVPPMSIS